MVYNVPEIHGIFSGGEVMSQQASDGVASSFTPLGGGSGTSSKFTLGGIIAVGVLLWLAGTNGSAELKKTINFFLFVLLLSIVLLRWDVIRPLILK